jgi:hypothetical protein
MNVSANLRAGFAALLVLTIACGGDTPAPAVRDAAEQAPAAQEPASGSVTILEPAQGAEVEGGLVTVRLSASGVNIVPAGDMTPGTGHHHLYLDEGLGAVGVPVPAIPGQVIHMGTGVSEYAFQDVAPGPHRLIAVVGDGLHVPLQPWVVDTVTFTVR